MSNSNLCLLSLRLWDLQQPEMHNDLSFTSYESCSDSVGPANSHWWWCTVIGKPKKKKKYNLWPQASVNWEAGIDGRSGNFRKRKRGERAVTETPQCIIAVDTTDALPASPGVPVTSFYSLWLLQSAFAPSNGLHLWLSLAGWPLGCWSPCVHRGREWEMP